ncbi:hypothetical protein PHYBLDRAFT_163992 [Phycomyces blakesleeanus NRRL 1555(-)]|uniref:Uncharacterized protein n=1 Tax=Phycomyces blakesleeanus (strain ATCC 8743b / DSM 1359 / FGSC 10004 / NBRC 33097 / NRRL 1555) TaxID=763407 RepID=A0A162Y830_PHYB8|nr:hypothetical protein PHYBLDRAFT_163992 [Phycomyces blakesleeanus NRRL 1555(-)]OAD78895.1 hypothetical protein PHYBLDRAFT_163992 [Phycomyces blakesleeanus NRRL 1555(-)]|eukprot:XP_018296935.1 hypothetical protein PHYBLDRAFT_163992 [Phycomyces blakesleeanus NRRL 1555(-)]
MYFSMRIYIFQLDMLDHSILSEELRCQTTALNYYHGNFLYKHLQKSSCGITEASMQNKKSRDDEINEAHYDKEFPVTNKERLFNFLNLSFTKSLTPHFVVEVVSEEPY